MRYSSMLLLCVLTVAVAGPVRGQEYPTKPVRYVVPFSAGGPTDIQARMFSEKLSQRLGKQFVVDNRAGANGSIGMSIVATADPDGYTIIQSAVNTWAVGPSLYKYPFDVVKDFAPITLLVTAPAVLVVNPSVPVKSVKDLVALAREKPGRLNFGSSGSGGIGHMSGELFCLATGTRMVHIPYKSAAPAMVAAIAGEIQVLFNNAIATVPFIKSGKVRGIAVTSLKRIEALPDLPTVDEGGVKGFENTSWSAIAAPAGTPGPIIAKLNREFNEVMRLPDVQEKIRAGGAEVIGGTPGQFADYLRSEIRKMARVVKAADIKGAE